MGVHNIERNWNNNMAEVRIDGFRFAEYDGVKTLLMMESIRLRDYVDYCNKHEVKSLCISCDLDNLDFLNECPGITAIDLPRWYEDVSGLYSLPRLTSLKIGYTHSIDFSAIPAIRHISTDWNPKIDAGIFASTELTSLWLRGYKPKSRNLSRLECFQNLERLDIIQAPMTTLAGIDKLHKLRFLDLAYCPKLADIKPLSGLSETLEELEIDHCNKIPNLTDLRNIGSLRKIMLAYCTALPSIGFIREMPKLEFLSFVETNVLDGDMTPCFNLRYAGFMNKRHFSHTYEEVRDIIEVRAGEYSLYK